MAADTFILQKGRPAGDSARSPEEIAVYDFLDRLHIPFDSLDTGVADTMENCAEISRHLGAAICKNLFLTNRQQTDFYLLMMPGDKPFKTKDLSKQINAARLSFADAEKMWEFLRIRPGAVSVLGLMNDSAGRVRLLIDRDILKNEYFGCHPCVNTTSLKIRLRDIFDIFLPAVRHECTFVDLPRPAENPEISQN